MSFQSKSWPKLNTYLLREWSKESIGFGIMSKTSQSNVILEGAGNLAEEEKLVVDQPTDPLEVLVS
jgi:hypothetical protein